MSTNPNRPILIGVTDHVGRSAKELRGKVREVIDGIDDPQLREFAFEQVVYVGHNTEHDPVFHVPKGRAVVSIADSCEVSNEQLLDAIERAYRAEAIQ